MEPADIIGVDDIDLIERIFRECHISDDSPRVPSHANAMVEDMAPELSIGAACGSSTVAASCVQVVTPEYAADELLKQIQMCNSWQESHAKCVEYMVAFHQNQMAAVIQQKEAEITSLRARLDKLHGANKVIVEGLRRLAAKHKDLQARCAQVDGFNTRASQALLQCREELLASERAKSMLQSHVQLMTSGRCETTHDVQKSLV